ncbi:unnamed protein product [Rangifer tarandus platyrhynchus]|uniref:Uncharacterized protein n=2 Tax=Rangifer tarandus platyrhynchus TaxID=3082113 RepID=A0ABN8YVW5_RANTA|nr:unnamed protein product [Rangifer tarandus platyrhynchus]
MTLSVRQHPSSPCPPDLSAPPPVPGPLELMEPASPSWGTLSAHLMVGRGLPYPEGSQDRRGGVWTRGEPQERKERRREGWGGARAPRGAPVAGPAPASQLHFSPRGGGGPGVGAGRQEGRNPPLHPQLPASALLPQGPCRPPSPLPGGAPALTADPTRASGACNQ